jgi:2-keto-myo-inositol isomerase
LAAAAGAAAVAMSGLEEPVTAQSSRPSSDPFGYCLNTSTIMGQKIGIVKEIELASQAGFEAIEPWISEIEEYQKHGGSLPDLRKRLADAGLKVPDAIGFAQWVVDDDAQRAKGLEQAKRDMELVAQIGGTHIAAPPAGAQDHGGIDLPRIAERYHALLEIGQKAGIIPVLELWGFSKILNRIGEVAYVAIEAAHPQACILLDIYHIYKGGSDFDSLRLLNGAALPLVHTNDYPSAPPRDQITDAFRVYPGDGVAPLDQIFRDLRTIGFTGYLSVELFNRDYWKQSPVKVVQAAMEKTKAAVHRAFG